MKNLKIKVSGVQTESEMLKLSQYVIDFISFSTNQLPMISSWLLENPHRALKLYGLSTDEQYDRDINVWNKIAIEQGFLEAHLLKNGIEYLEVTDRLFSPDFDACQERLKRVTQSGLKIIFSGLEWDLEFVPAAPFETSTLAALDLISYFQIEFNTDYTNSWWLYKNQLSTGNPHVISLCQFQEMTQKYPIMLSVDYNNQNVMDIVNSLPDLKGINLSLHSHNHYYEHTQSLDQIIQILEILKRNKTEVDKAVMLLS